MLRFARLLRTTLRPFHSEQEVIDYDPMPTYPFTATLQPQGRTAPPPHPGASNSRMGAHGGRVREGKKEALPAPPGGEAASQARRFIARACSNFSGEVRRVACSSVNGSRRSGGALKCCAVASRRVARRVHRPCTMEHRREWSSDATPRFFATIICENCHFVEWPGCREHSRLLTQRLRSGAARCDVADCETSTEAASPWSEHCRRCHHHVLRLTFWGIQPSEADYAAQTLAALPLSRAERRHGVLHTSLVCNLCGLAGFPGHDGKLTRVTDAGPFTLPSGESEDAGFWTCSMPHADLCPLVSAGAAAAWHGRSPATAAVEGVVANVSQVQIRLSLDEAEFLRECCRLTTTSSMELAPQDAVSQVFDFSTRHEVAAAEGGAGESDDSGVVLELASGDATIDGSFVVADMGGFPTAVAPVSLSSGRYYYEVEVCHAALIQAGWSRSDDGFFPRALDGSGVGDDAGSWSFDGHRGYLWHGSHYKTWGVAFSAGDVLGCAFDAPGRRMLFSLNGSWSEPMGTAFTDIDPDSIAAGLRPAISLAEGASARLRLRKSDLVHFPPSSDYRAVIDSIPETDGHVLAEADTAVDSDESDASDAVYTLSDAPLVGEFECIEGPVTLVHSTPGFSAPTVGYLKRGSRVACTSAKRGGDGDSIWLHVRSRGWVCYMRHAGRVDFDHRSGATVEELLGFVEVRQDTTMRGIVQAPIPARPPLPPVSSEGPAVVEERPSPARSSVSSGAEGVELPGMQVVRNNLSRFKLTEYADAFEEHGYDDWADLVSLASDPDEFQVMLEVVGMSSKRGHISRLSRALKQAGGGSALSASRGSGSSGTPTPDAEGSFVSALSGSDGAVSGGAGGEASPLSATHLPSLRIASIPMHDLSALSMVGGGGFGVVYRSSWHEIDVAVKVLRNARSVGELAKELDAMQKVGNHPRVVQLLGIVPSSTGSSIKGIVTQYKAKGSVLLQLCRNAATAQPRPRSPCCTPKSYRPNLPRLGHSGECWAARMPILALLRVAQQAAAGMVHLHHENVLHRDLSARNVLIDEHGDACICDFGFSLEVNEHAGTVETQSDLRPVKWLAPEALRGHTSSAASDVWQFGVLLFELLTYGGEPYAELSMAEAAAHVLGGGTLVEYLPAAGVPPPLRELLGRCFQQDADARPSMVEVHRMLRDIYAELAAAGALPQSQQLYEEF